MRVVSPTSEYALRAILYLASSESEARTNQQVAAATKVPTAYLSKVLQALGRAGLLTSQRGLGGGFRLARGMDEISMLDVINSVDPIMRIDSCPMEIPEHTPDLCPLHSRLALAMDAIEVSFRETTLGELVRAHQKGGACRRPVPVELDSPEDV
ncbi:MAG: Rrf2 family transcriptional regulator [Planctomycetota bacterium]